MSARQTPGNKFVIIIQEDTSVVVEKDIASIGGKNTDALVFWIFLIYNKRNRPKDNIPYFH